MRRSVTTLRTLATAARRRIIGGDQSRRRATAHVVQRVPGQVWYKGAFPTEPHRMPRPCEPTAGETDETHPDLAAALGVCTAAPRSAQTKWDMPTRVPADQLPHREHRAVRRRRRQGDRRQAQDHGPRQRVAVQGATRSSARCRAARRRSARSCISGYSNEDPLFGVDSVPFLATSYADAAKLWKASRKAHRRALREAGHEDPLLRAVAAAGHLLEQADRLASADMKGLKMRTYNPATSRIAELAGAQPVTIQVAELAQAMATGAVNANITSGATGYDTKAWEQVKYFYDTQAWLPKNIVFVEQEGVRRARQGDARRRVLKAAADAEARGWKISEEKTKWYLEQLAKNGMNVAPPSPQLTADLKKIGDTMTAEWLEAGRAGRPGDRRRVPEDVSRDVAADVPMMRRLLDALYDAAAYLAALFLVGTLAMVLLGIFGRLFGFQAARHRRLRRLLHGGRELPRARPHAEARRAHPRDSDPRARWRAASRARSSSGRLARRPFFGAAFAWFSVAPRVAVVHATTTSRRATTRRRCGFRRSRWPRALVLFAIAVRRSARWASWHGDAARPRARRSRSRPHVEWTSSSRRC